MENCKQLFSPLLAITTQKIATHSTDIISAVCVGFLWVVNASRNEKSCLQFLIPTAVFHILLREMLRKKIFSDKFKIFEYREKSEIQEFSDRFSDKYFHQ